MGHYINVFDNPTRPSPIGMKRQPCLEILNASPLKPYQRSPSVVLSIRYVSWIEC
jgi:hypothetical protein